MLKQVYTQFKHIVDGARLADKVSQMRAIASASGMELPEDVEGEEVDASAPAVRYPVEVGWAVEPIPLYVSDHGEYRAVGLEDEGSRLGDDVKVQEGH